MASKPSVRQKKTTQVVVEKKEEVQEVDIEVNHEKSTVKNSHVEKTKEMQPQIQKQSQPQIQKPSLPQAQVEMNEKEENSQNNLYDSDQSTQDWPNKENNVKYFS